MSTRKLVGALAVLALATACSSGGSSTSAPKVSAAGPDDRPVKKGGTITIALNADPDALDPTTATTLNGREVFTSICEKLYDIDATSKLVPQLATALPQTSPDGKTVTIKLRTGVKFNDGTTMDAAAVKKSLDRHRTLKASARAADLATVQKVDVVDPSTVRLTLSQPFTPLTAQLADRAGMIMSPKALDAEGDNFGAKPVCVGPFKFVSRTSGSQIVVDRSPFYYDAAKVKPDRVIYKIIVDPNVEAANLKSGDIQIADQMATTAVASVQADPNLRVVSGGGFGNYGFSINIGNAHGSAEKAGPVNTPLGKSLPLRQAFDLALDRNAINKAVFNGLYEPDCGPLPIASPFRPRSIPCPGRDIAKAKQLVAQSGVKTPIRVDMIVPNNTQSERLGQVIQQMEKEAGFDVHVQPQEFVTTLDMGKAGKFDTLANGWSGRVDPDGDLTGLVTSGGVNNYSGISDPGIDGPIKQAAATADVNKRAQLYNMALTKLANLHAQIYLYHNKYYLGTRKNIAGIKYYEDGLPRLATAGYVAS
jgi:peptide/nickel transport system substrate-binding protein